MKITKKLLAIGTAAVALTLITASTLTTFAAPKNSSAASLAQVATNAKASARASLKDCINNGTGIGNGGECVNPDGICDGTGGGNGTGIGNGGSSNGGGGNGSGTGIGNGGECANPDGICTGTGTGNGGAGNGGGNGGGKGGRN